MKLFGRLRESDKGQGLVEYGLILALVSVVAVGALGGVGDKVSDTFNFSMGGGGMYKQAEITALVSEGYIPISTAEELNGIRDNKVQSFGWGTEWKGNYRSGLDKRYIQVANIDMSEVGVWEPIGNSMEKLDEVDHINSFRGEYDGGGFEVKNLVVNHENHAGLFGYAYEATFKNVNLEDVDINGLNYTGGLVGHQIKSLVKDSYSSGNIKGRAYVGGLVGYNGRPYASKIVNSDSSADVSGSGYLGGLVGEQGGNSVVSSSYATGNISDGNYTGGLVGIQHGESIVINSYATGSVGTSKVGISVGGLVGQQTAQSTIDNSYAVGKVLGSKEVGGLLGNNIGGLITHSGWASDANEDVEGVGLSNVNIADGHVIGQPSSKINDIIKSLID